MEARPWAVFTFATVGVDLGDVVDPGAVAAGAVDFAAGADMAEGIVPAAAPAPTAVESGNEAAVLIRRLPLSAPGASSCVL